MIRYASAVMVFGALVGCAESPAADDVAPSEGDQSAAPARGTRGQQVETVTVEPETFVERIDVSATVTTRHDVVLSARASGTINRVVDLGEPVKKGQVLAQIDAELARAQLARAEAGLDAAEASLKLAQDTYERQKPLFEKEVISPLEFEQIASELNQAKANEAQARAQVAQAREQLEQSRVVAPFDGAVEEKFVDDGEQVTMGAPVVRVVDADIVKVRGGVPERYAPDIEPGTTAEVRFTAYGLEPREGPVTFVSSVIDPASRTFTVEVELDNPDRRLKPEMVARILLERAQVPNALVVPQTAVLHDSEGDAVFVVQRDGEVAVAQLRRVELGPRAQGEVVVESGLEPGDEVIVVGQNSVSSGDAVEVAAETP
jgi:RND family efflux transporter MFP subunit